MIVFNNTTKRKINTLLILGIFLMSVLYLYLFQLTNFKAVEGKENLRKLQELTAEYQKLEESYLATLEKFTLDYALALGFIVDNQKEIIVRIPETVAQR